MPMSSSIPPSPTAASSPAPLYRVYGEGEATPFDNPVIKDTPSTNPNSILPTLPNITSNDLAWMAGLFDGEGCIAISRIAPKKRQHAPYYVLTTILGMVQEYPAHLFTSIFGGRSYCRKKSSKASTRPQYYWQAQQWRAARAIKALRPYLRIKCGQADLALEFVELRRYKSKGHSFTDDELKEQSSYHERMAALNHSCWIGLRRSAADRDTIESGTRHVK